MSKLTMKQVKLFNKKNQQKMKAQPLNLTKKAIPKTLPKIKVHNNKYLNKKNKQLPPTKYKKTTKKQVFH